MKYQSALIFIFIFSCQNYSFALDCKDGGNNQLDMNQCSSQKLEESTKKINKVYNEYRKSLTDDEKKSLRDIQMAWIKYKDLRCKFSAAGYEGGSMQGMVMTNCLADVTNQRLKELEDELKEKNSR